MRIKYTSLHSVIGGNSAAPWVGNGLAERLKLEAMERETGKKHGRTDRKRKGERALGWLRRSR